MIANSSWFEKRRVCVVGASGFLGQPTVKLLSSLGARVRAVSRRDPKKLLENVDWLEGDIADEHVMRRALTGISGVIFLASAGIPGSGDIDIAREIDRHVRIPVKLAEHAVAEGVERLIFASSGGTIYGLNGRSALETDATAPLNAYGVSKMAVEAYLRVIGRGPKLSIASLRISNPYGEGQSSVRGQGFISAAMRAALNSEPLHVWGDGSVVRDYIHVDDVAQALVLALMHSGQETEFNIGSGQGRSLTNVLQVIQEVSGLLIDVRYERGRAIDVPFNVLDISRAVSRLAWKPTITFEDGLRRTFRWCEEALSHSG